MHFRPIQLMRFTSMVDWMIRHDLLVRWIMIVVGGVGVAIAGGYMKRRSRRQQAPSSEGATAAPDPRARRAWVERATAEQLAAKRTVLGGWDVRTMSDDGARRYMVALSAVSLAHALMNVPIAGRGLRWTRLLNMVLFSALGPVSVVRLARWSDKARQHTIEDRAGAEKEMARSILMPIIVVMVTIFKIQDELRRMFRRDHDPRDRSDATTRPPDSPS